MALGASAGQIRSAVLGTAMTVVGIGGAVGLIVALLASQLLARLLFEISPTDPIALAGSCVVLLCAGLAAAYLPARRATLIDPAVALRSE